jgi:hypothetical protein
MPDVGARSVPAEYEYLADSIALLATGGFDGTDEAQARIRDITFELIGQVIQAKFAQP